VILLGIKKTLIHVYDVHYRKLMVFSFLLLFACIGILAVQTIRTGELFAKGVSLKGGITMTVPIDHHIDTNVLQEQLSKRFPQSDLDVREISRGGVAASIIIEASDITGADLEPALPELGIPIESGQYTLQSQGSALGSGFFQQTIKAVIFAFISMAIVVFITFRTPVPSSFVILAAISDIVSTLAVIDLLGVKLSTAGIAAFLMLIGYSVDTDILLTTKVLKRKNEGGTIFERTLNATRTGIFMTLTALAASTIGLIFSQSDTIRQIMLVTLIGLIFDMIYTWFQNAGILRIYMEKLEKKHEHH